MLMSLARPQIHQALPMATIGLVKLVLTTHRRWRTVHFPQFANRPPPLRQDLIGLLSRRIYQQRMVQVAAHMTRTTAGLGGAVSQTCGAPPTIIGVANLGRISTKGARLVYKVYSASPTVMRCAPIQDLKYGSKPRRHAPFRGVWMPRHLMQNLAWMVRQKTKVLPMKSMILLTRTRRRAPKRERARPKTMKKQKKSQRRSIRKEMQKRSVRKMVMKRARKTLKVLRRSARKIVMKKEGKTPKMLRRSARKVVMKKMQRRMRRRRSKKMHKKRRKKKRKRTRVDCRLPANLYCTCW
mmetsp:Transcript_40120/g.74405  ORF Transcript_40120/g.74405 Transcript_40120/m.74405 type:complete len:296 (-) Transcript_40120:4790-5677(-)